MWYGKDTEELTALKREYEEKFGYNPDGEIELEYGPNSYKKYVSDIKKAIQTEKHLADFVD